jgi:hypothetical protein
MSAAVATGDLETITLTLGSPMTPAMAAQLIEQTDRPIHTVFIHCSASDRPEHDSAHVMDRWHKQRRWTGIGYHLFIRKDGIAEYGRDWNKTPAAQAGHNTGTLAICLHGLAETAFTAEQQRTLSAFAAAIDDALYDKNGEQTRFRGHREVAAKACPVIDYHAWLDLDNTGFRHGGPGRRPTFPSPASSNHSGLLSIGDGGPNVAALQRALNRWGETLTVDGRFGKQTEAAVRRYQLDHWALKTDGIAGPKTIAHLTERGYWQ